jgi:hypothetical protein
VSKHLSTQQHRVMLTFTDAAALPCALGPMTKLLIWFCHYLKRLRRRDRTASLVWGVQEPEARATT